MRILLAIIFACNATSALANEILSDLGLAWGQTQKALIKKNYNLQYCSKNNDVTSCEVLHSAKGVALGAQYILFFDEDNGLQKLQMPIKHITDDATGLAGKSLYNELKKHLNKRYGIPKSYEYTGRKTYFDYDEFYECLRHEGCGSWVSFWHMENGDYTYIALSGIANSSGYLILFTESELWQDIAEGLN